MSKNKLLLLLALLLAAATGAWAQGPWTSGACTVTFSDGVMTVSGTGAMADYKDYNATPWYGKDIETIVIESGVTSIGVYAFAGSEDLESVSIPASVTSIGDGAFEDCGINTTTPLTVSFAEGSTPLTIGERAFNYANLKSIDIPNRVTSIGERAFNSCSNLESVSIPASVTSIGEGAFRNCSMLAKVYIYAPSLTTYGADAFQSNASGRKIYVLPEAVDTYKAGWSAYAADIEAMTLYATSIKEGTKDADKWTISPNPAPEGSPVTLQYTGRLKVKGVKATSEAAAKPDLLPAVFTVDAGKTVKFSKGNLQATYNGSSWIWGFAEHQWDYIIGNAAGNTSINGNGTVSANGTVDLFGWVGASSTWTGAAQYGISNSTATNNVDGYGNVGGEAQKVGWGATVGTGWRTLTRLEWLYLLSERATGVTVNSTDNARYTQATINTDGTAVKGLIIFPDSYAGGSPAGVTWGTINAKSTFETTCTSAGWTALEAAGCVFLPAAGYRQASNVTDAGIGGGYWSSSSNTAPYAFALYFESDYMTIQYGGSRKYGFSVRLVQATSDAEPAAPASTTLNNTITAWTAGTYAVPAGGLTYSDAITVSGDVTLTLTDGETLTLNKGISLAEGATLTVEGNGTMNVNGTNENTTSTVAGSTGTLILTSGTLTATGGNGGSVDVLENDAHGGNGGVAINGSVIVSGGSLTARGGNGGSVDFQSANCSGGNGGDAISGSVIVSGGTLTASGGNGGSVGDFCENCSGGNGGDAISGTLTKNGGSTSVNDGSNGSIGGNCDESTAGTGGTSEAGSGGDIPNSDPYTPGGDPFSF